MAILIPINDGIRKYPPEITTNLQEISGDFAIEKPLSVNFPYSLHTESAHSIHIRKKERITFNSKIITDFENIASAQRNGIPQLWRNVEWSNEFFEFINWLVGSSIPPEILEIHPPFIDYCNSFDNFLDIFKNFQKIFYEKYNNTKVVIENRCGTLYKDEYNKEGKFLLSTHNDVLKFAEILYNNPDIRLKIVLDYPQIFSAIIAEDNKISMDNLESAVEKIKSFNKDLKKYRTVISGLHMWGKIKNKNGKWNPHSGDFDTFFSNNQSLKYDFLESVFDAFNDDIPRYFVPEVYLGSQEDLHSIVYDMEKAGFIFLSKKCYNFYNYSFYGIKIPINKIDNRESGFFEKDGWLIQFCFGMKDNKEYMDCYCQNKMTNDRHERIYEDGKSEDLPALDYFDYGFNQNDTEDINNEKMKNKKNEIKDLLTEKGFFPFPYTNNMINNINIYFKNNLYLSNKEFHQEEPNAEFKELPYGIYLGDLLDNKPHGKGALFYTNGNIFEGDFIDGELSKGKEIFSNGSIFEGDFANDEPSKGKETFKNGIVYEGELVDGKGHGKGKMTFANGDVYEGDFFEGNINGIGKKTYIDGKVEEGFWVNGIFFPNIKSE